MLPSALSARDLIDKQRKAVVSKGTEIKATLAKAVKPTLVNSDVI